MTASFSVGLWLSLLSAHSRFVFIPFLIISSDAFGVTNIYLLLNTLIKILKFPLSIPVATNWVYISGICAGFFLIQGSSTFRYFHRLVPGRPPYYSRGAPCRYTGSIKLGRLDCVFFVIVMYVLLVVTTFPSQTESVLRLLRQQNFVAISFAFSSCCK
jgi:hypothetical protein